MRCCPMCYCKAYLKNTGAMTCGTTMKLQYEISCSNCGLGPAKTGAVLMTYNEHNSIFFSGLFQVFQPKTRFPDIQFFDTTS